MGAIPRLHFLTYSDSCVFQQGLRSVLPVDNLNQGWQQVLDVGSHISLYNKDGVLIKVVYPTLQWWGQKVNLHIYITST